MKQQLFIGHCLQPVICLSLTKSLYAAFIACQKRRTNECPLFGCAGRRTWHLKLRLSPLNGHFSHRLCTELNRCKLRSCIISFMFSSIMLSSAAAVAYNTTHPSSQYKLLDRWDLELNSFFTFGHQVVLYVKSINNILFLAISPLLWIQSTPNEMQIDPFALCRTSWPVSFSELWLCKTCSVSVFRCPSPCWPPSSKPAPPPWRRSAPPRCLESSHWSSRRCCRAACSRPYRTSCRRWCCRKPLTWATGETVVVGERQCALDLSRLKENARFTVLKAEVDC